MAPTPTQVDAKQEILPGSEEESELRAATVVATEALREQLALR